MRKFTKTASAVSLGMVLVTSVCLASGSSSSSASSESTSVLSISRTMAKAPQGPLTVDKAVQLALQNNYSYQIALSKAEKAKAADSETRAALNGVNVKASAQYTREKEVNNNMDGFTIPMMKADNFASSINATKQIDITGVNKATTDTTRLSARISKEDLRRVRQEIALGAKTSFYNIVSARQLVKMNDEALQSAEEHLRVVQQQYSNGTASQFDELRSEVQVTNYKQSKLAAENALNLAESAFRTALGLPKDTPVDIQEPDSPQVGKFEIDPSVDLAMKNRPDLHELDMAVTLSKLGIKIAKGNILPTMALTGAYSYNPTSTNSASENMWSVSAGISIPIFDSGVTRAKVKSAQEDQAVSEATLQQMKEGVALEVRQDVLSIRDAQSRLESSEANVTEAREALRLSQVRFSAGVSTQVEVMDSQVAFTQAQTNYITALNDLRQALAQYDKAIGKDI